MTDRRRVAITGIGVISAIGRGREETLQSVREGRIGVRTISNFDSSAFSCQIAGEVPDEKIQDKLDEHRDLDRFARLALIAADEAMSQSSTGPALSGPELGTLIGTGLGGSQTLDNAYLRLYAQNLTRIPPMSIPRAMYNAAASAVAARHHAQGPSFSVVSACASGAHSIGQAAHWIRSGLVKAVLAGASDAPLAPGIMRGWESMRILSNSNDDPAGACRPFSADRKGIVLAEGAAVLLLEDFEQAQARKATILGEIAGFGMSSDAGHLTDPSVDGPVRAMEMAMRDARIGPFEIGYINAHGTATRSNDAMETKAIRQLFGSGADEIAVSSTKAMHGHAMGASGAIEIALSLLALNAGVIPPNMNLSLPDPACDLNYVANVPRQERVTTFLSNSFGFGGMNGVVAVRTVHGL